jgi:general secretion pathway protein K
VPVADARPGAEAAVDWLDSDTVPGPAGAEDPAYASPGRGGRTANTLFAEPSELRAVIGVSPALYDRIRPWICALPTTDLSPINVNTLSPDDAVLLAMLAPGRMSIDQARRVIAVRPASGWGNLVDFWRTERISELDPPLDVQLQPQIKTVWFRMETRVATEGAELIQTALIDARLGRPRLVVRRWGPED